EQQAEHGPGRAGPHDAATAFVGGSHLARFPILGLNPNAHRAASFEGLAHCNGPVPLKPIKPCGEKDVAKKFPDRPSSKIRRSTSRGRRLRTGAFNLPDQEEKPPPLLPLTSSSPVTSSSTTLSSRKTLPWNCMAVPLVGCARPVPKGRYTPSAAGRA